MRVVAGVIGCGNISRFHFSGLEKAGARVKWVCDLNEGAARPWAAKFDAAYTADYRALVRDPAVNTVVITALSAVHKEICLDAIRAGKAVICEKTLAENPEDALAIVRAARRRKTIFYTSYMKRFIPAVEQAKALLPSLGRILSTHIRAYQCWGDLWTRNPPEGFFHTPRGGKSLVARNYGGGILVCGGSHILDLVGFLLGRPHRLYATMATTKGSDYDVQAAVLLETANGVVHFESLAHPLTRIGFLRDGWDERIEINGLNGRLEIYSAAWDQVEHKASLLVHTDNTTGQTVEYRYAPVSPFDRAVAFFCNSIAHGRQGAQSAVTGYDVDELIAHIKKSAVRHQAVDIQWRI
ncbi:MAG: Gfo/Idh/MocA family oxidoreductase [Kiritimatiellae bacterium]|nr:Gfo/Idh/MocA family oxidoreductase [Kiritimatiellia bacterium]